MSNRPNRTPRPGGHRPPARRRGLVLAVAALVVVGLGVVVAILANGSDGGGDDADQLAFAPVATEGTALPVFAADAPDPAVGAAAPVLEGSTPSGDPITLGGPGRPTLIAFVAHWCPHCQAEVPRIVDLAERGQLTGVRLVAVVTGTNPDAPNYPPAPWLDRERWPGEVLVDDKGTSAASAYGLAGYPFLVAVDADGQVVARSSGELPASAVAELAAKALQQ